MTEQWPQSELNKLKQGNTDLAYQLMEMRNAKELAEKRSLFLFDSREDLIMKMAKARTGALELAVELAIAISLSNKDYKTYQHGDNDD